MVVVTETLRDFYFDIFSILKQNRWFPIFRRPKLSINDVRAKIRKEKMHRKAKTDRSTSECLVSLFKIPKSCCSNFGLLECSSVLNNFSYKKIRF